MIHRVAWNRRRFVHSAFLMAMVVTLLSFTAGRANAQWSEYRCETYVEFENRERRVFGMNIAAECKEDGHSVPFGNWGVDSNRGAVRNAFQFPGWKKECTCILGICLFCDLRQWNSCTRDHPPAEYSQYYNGSGHNQIADPDSTAFYGGGTEQGPDGATCESLGPVESLRGNYMDLWEIDLFGGRDNDELVAKLTYPSVDVPMTCDSEWDCHGSSEWLSPSLGDDAVSADIRITVRRYQVICSINPEGDECF